MHCVLQGKKIASAFVALCYSAYRGHVLQAVGHALRAIPLHWLSHLAQDTLTVLYDIFRLKYILFKKI